MSPIYKFIMNTQNIRRPLMDENEQPQNSNLFKVIMLFGAGLVVY